MLLLESAAESFGCCHLKSRTAPIYNIGLNFDIFLHAFVRSNAKRHKRELNSVLHIIQYERRLSMCAFWMCEQHRKQSMDLLALECLKSHKIPFSVHMLWMCARHRKQPCLKKFILKCTQRNSKRNKFITSIQF